MGGFFDDLFDLNGDGEVSPDEEAAGIGFLWQMLEQDDDDDEDDEL